MAFSIHSESILYDLRSVSALLDDHNSSLQGTIQTDMALAILEDLIERIESGNPQVSA